MTEKDWFCDAVRQNENAMYALACSILRNPSDGEEAVSEAIYRGYSRLDTLRDKRVFKTWMLTIVHNVSIEMIRRRDRNQELEEHLEPASHDEDIATRLTQKGAVESLPEPYRTVIVLHYYDDLSASQISEVTGAGPAAVRQQLSRARKMLKERLKEDLA